MATIAQNFQPGSVGGKPDTFGKLRSAVGTYRIYRRIYKELDALSDRDLADIGVARHDIRQIAWEASHRG